MTDDQHAWLFALWALAGLTFQIDRAIQGKPSIWSIMGNALLTMAAVLALLKILRWM